jgi:hypothetical protein
MTDETKQDAAPANLPAVATEPYVPARYSFDNLLNPEKFEHIWRVAKAFAISGMVPDHFKTTEAAFVAVQMAVRLEVDPFMLMQHTYVIHGRPGMTGQLAIALVNARGPFRTPIMFELTGDGGSRACTAYAEHGATGKLCEMTVSMAMAQAEGWTSNKKWQSIPDLMLQYRAGAWLGRVYAPECLMGLLTEDELRDMGPLVEAADGTYQPAPPRPQQAEFVDRKVATEPEKARRSSTDPLDIPPKLDKRRGKRKAKAAEVVPNAAQEPHETENPEPQDEPMPGPDTYGYVFMSDSGEEVVGARDIALGLYLDRIEKCPGEALTALWTDNAPFRKLYADSADETAEMVQAWCSRTGRPPPAGGAK